MPKVDDTPPGLSPFLSLGVDLAHREGQEWAEGDCIFCSRPGRFHVHHRLGTWNCKKCEAGGDTRSFLREYLDLCRQSYRGSALEELAESRGYLSTEPLDYWGVTWSVLSEEVLVPGYDPAGVVSQVYRYMPSKDGRHILIPLPGLGHHLHGVLPPNRPNADDRDGVGTVYFCEGPWDGMALWETMRFSKRGGGEDGSLSVTGDPTRSMLVTATVVAAPGVAVWKPEWYQIFNSRDVILCYDSDHPRKHPKTGRKIEPAGLGGMKRATRHMLGSSKPPMSISYIHWGDGGFNPDLPSGYDVRDHLKVATSPAGRVSHLFGLFELVKPAPTDWSSGPLSRDVGAGDKLGCTPCTSWETLRTSWRKALKWTDGLEGALACMLSACMSTRLIGDQLWLKVLSPPSTGKSVLCEALSVNKEWVFPKSTIRGFHSGYQNDRDGTEDNSLIVRLDGKTLVTKDGDTLLTSPNLPQILAEGRDLYDTTSRSQYRNKMSRDYENKRITWILCGTDSLRQLDASELGERFVSWVIMERVDDDLEEEIGWRKINQVRNVRGEVNGRADSHMDPALAEAMSLTGGYVGWLRENALRLYTNVEMDDETAGVIIKLGRFVSYMRARPSTKQDETAGREMSARLISQLGRLALCLGAVVQTGRVNEAVLNMVRKAALDTSIGKTLNLVRALDPWGEEGLEAPALALLIQEELSKVRTFLTFLCKIKVVERFRPTKSFRAGMGVVKTGGVSRYRLAPRLKALFDEVIGVEPEPEEEMTGDDLQ